MSIDQNHPAVASLQLHFDDVDNVLPVPSSEVLPNLMHVPSNHSLPVHSLPEPLPVFPNLVDHSVQNGSDMHVSQPNLTTSAFLDTPTPLDPVAFPTPAAASSVAFIPDFNPPFSVCSPVENGMTVKVSPSSGHAPSPPMTVPSAVIHGQAASYGPGVSSSLQSAFDPSVMPTGQLGISSLPVARPVIPVASTVLTPPPAPPAETSSQSLTNILDQYVAAYV